MTELDRSSREWLERYRSRVRGCLLGGAVGDALGAPVELLSWQDISAAYGPEGVTDLVVAQRSQLHGDYGPYTRWTTRYPGS